MSFLDDLLNFGSGALEAVGEQSDWLFGGSNNSSNPTATQQPQHPIVDNNGNAVTTPQGQVSNAIDPMWMYMGGGFVMLLLLLIAVMAFKK